MSDSPHNPYASGELSRRELTNQVARDMGKGFFMAAIVVGVVVGFVLFIKLVGWFLPPESKEAVDPSLGEFSSLVIEAPRIDRAG